MKRVYLDNAATTPIDPKVVEVMTEAMINHYGNPSSIHADGRRSRAALEEARKKVARNLGASIGEIFFTSGGTESNNMALKCSVRDLGVQRIISSRVEHHCILHSLESLEKTHDVEIVFVDLDGRVIPEHLESLLKSSDKKTLVSLMHSNNEIGTMIDLDQIAAICKEHQAFFHSDTVQTVGFFPIDVSSTPINFLSGSAHKFHGPKGVGFIYINGENIIKPYMDGGAQERNMRGGTENLYGIIGLATALDIAYAELEQRKEQVKALRDYFADQIKTHLDGARINGDPTGNGHYKVLSVSFPASDKGELLLLNLDIAGISVSGGSACSSGADKGSHVIQALGIDPGWKTIRFSFSHNNTRDEVEFVIDKLKSILQDSAKKEVV